MPLSPPFLPGRLPGESENDFLIRAMAPAAPGDGQRRDDRAVLFRVYAPSWCRDELAANRPCQRDWVNGFVSNQNVNGLEERIENLIFMKYVLLDEVRPTGPSPTESVTFTWRSNTTLTTVVVGGRTRTRFIAGTHSVAVPLDPQR
jgi:hypothetical protein